MRGQFESLGVLLRAAYSREVLSRTTSWLRIADLARTDSASVRTISMLGLVFLPGTFVSVSCSREEAMCAPVKVSHSTTWLVLVLYSTVGLVLTVVVLLAMQLVKHVLL